LKRQAKTKHHCSRASEARGPIHLGSTLGKPDGRKIKFMTAAGFIFMAEGLTRQPLLAVDILWFVLAELEQLFLILCMRTDV
jgi:hypothetical protein